MFNSLVCSIITSEIGDKNSPSKIAEMIDDCINEIVAGTIHQIDIISPFPHSEYVKGHGR